MVGGLDIFWCTRIVAGPALIPPSTATSDCPRCGDFRRDSGRVKFCNRRLCFGAVEAEKQNLVPQPVIRPPPPPVAKAPIQGCVGLQGRCHCMSTASGGESGTGIALRTGGGGDSARLGLGL